MEENTKELQRLLQSLSNSEADIVAKLFEHGEKTGYATVDRPWDYYYKNIKKNKQFINTTPYQGLIESNREFPHEIAIEYFGNKISFGELEKKINSAAKSLEEYNVKKGDFVTICSTTTPEVIYTFYALSKIGAVANIISPFYTPEELMSRISECNSRLIIIVDKFLSKFKEVINKELKRQIIVLPIMNCSILKYVSSTCRVNKKSNEISWNEFVDSGSHRSDANFDPYEYRKPQAMVYSSGTTGASKGILLSVDSFQKLINAYGNSGFDILRGQTVYTNAPPWASTGISLGINFPLSYGVRLCIDPRFEQNIFVKNVLKFKPDYILTSSSMYRGFTLPRNIKKLKNKSLSFLKYPVEGGELLTEKDICNIEKVFKEHGFEAKLLNGYGQCECGATITTDITGCKFSNMASGIPLPDITIVGIFDDDYKELRYGERGNILVKTQIGMTEYFKNPKDTKDFFYIDVNGEQWSKTGDIGYINEDGSLTVLGRKSDYSIINSKKIYNFDVEWAILSSEKVKLCEVQTHPYDEQKLVAHIIFENHIKEKLKQNMKMQIKILRELQDNVLNVMKFEEAVPYNFCIRDDFPTATSGKRDIQFIKNNIENLIELYGEK